MKRTSNTEPGRRRPRTRLYLPGSGSLPYGGWVGVLRNGQETIDFGTRKDAEDCAAYFQALLDDDMSALDALSGAEESQP